MTQHNNDSLGKFAAPCGLYCGACVALVARKRDDLKQLESLADKLAKHTGRPATVEDVNCKGCQSDTVSVHCRDCDIRECAFSKGLTHCCQCSDFPCQRITDFNNDEYPHHSEVLENIKRQREVGVDMWLKEQDRRWRCPGCGAATCWYADKCPNCGDTLDNKFGLSPF